MRPVKAWPKMCASGYKGKYRPKLELNMELFKKTPKPLPLLVHSVTLTAEWSSLHRIVGSKYSSQHVDALPLL